MQRVHLEHYQITDQGMYVRKLPEARIKILKMIRAHKGTDIFPVLDTE